MSAIGDYVHLYRSHYAGENGSGIKRWTKENRGTYVAYAFQQQKDLIQARMNANQSQLTDTQIQAMRANLSYILSNYNDSSTINQRAIAVQQQIMQSLQEHWEDKLGSVNWDTGNVTVDNITEKRNEALTYIGKAKDDKNRKFSTLYSRIKLIEAFINQITSPANKDKIQNQINSIKQELASVLSIAKKDIAELALINDNSTFNQLFKELNYNSEQANAAGIKIGSLVTDLNSIIKMLGSTKPVNSQKGELFEYAIEGLKGMMKAEAEDELYIASVKAIGTEREKTTIYMDRFSQYFKPKMVELKQNDETGNIELGASQGKVDVTITFKDSTTANISAKNVNLSSGFDVHILSGSPLLYLLQDQDSDFVNHYLNLAAWHPDGIGSLGPQLMAAREAVKITILWQAISGDVIDRQIADTFIVNDNSKTGIESIQIYDIPKLVNKACENMAAFVNITSSTGDSIDTLTFYNKRHSRSYSERISNLLKDVYAQKISVTLSPALLSAIT